MHTPPQLTWSCASEVPSGHMQVYVLSSLTQMSEQRFSVSSPHSLMSGEGRGGEGGGGREGGGEGGGGGRGRGKDRCTGESDN